jgi:hypothetical protein
VEWAKLSEEVVARNYGRRKDNVGGEAQVEATPDA